MDDTERRERALRKVIRTREVARGAGHAADKALVDAWAAGVPAADLMAAFGWSRATFYRRLDAARARGAL